MAIAPRDAPAPRRAGRQLLLLRSRLEHGEQIVAFSREHSRKIGDIEHINQRLPKAAQRLQEKERLGRRPALAPRESQRLKPMQKV